MNLRKLLLAAVVAVAAFPSAGALAHGDCDGAGHTHTASGSCKDSDDHNIECGSKGQLAKVGGIGVYANQKSNGAEAEFCADEEAGSGNTNGRLMADVNTAEQGARVILDSDRDQPFDAGWITVQVSGKSGNGNGVYCTKDPGEVGVNEGDGYEQPWTKPGPDNGLPECAPNPPV